MEKVLMETVKTEVDRILSELGKSREEKLTAICRVLVDRVDHYDWVGFYLVDAIQDRELILGPFVGDPTEHVRIAFGQGICGQAAETGKTFIVQDVDQAANYLSCSPAVKSEIVVPIFRDAIFVGELDIDSHILAPFTQKEREFLEEICERISQIF